MTDPRPRVIPALPAAPERSPGAPPDPEALREERELQEVSRLLRELPDPQPPADLTQRVMARVEAREARPKVIRVFFERASEPRFAAGLAAGVACLVLATALQTGRLDAAGTALGLSERAPAPMATATTLPTTVRWRAASQDPRVIALFAGEGVDGDAAWPETSVQPPLSAAARVDRGLDRQLDLLITDPDAFFQRLERVSSHDPYVARLAERAARRGDATEVALLLRSLERPRAEPLVEPFLRASLLRRVNAR